MKMVAEAHVNKKKICKENMGFSKVIFIKRSNIVQKHTKNKGLQICTKRTLEE